MLNANISKTKEKKKIWFLFIGLSHVQYPALFATASSRLIFSVSQASKKKPKTVRTNPLFQQTQHFQASEVNKLKS